jgi:hypothetical protein
MRLSWHDVDVIRTVAIVLAIVLLLVSSAAAEVPEGTDEVEEDWVLVIQDVSPDESAPQIANVISPTETIDADYGVLELNHTTQPDYVDGGLQLQRWNGSYICEYCRASAHDRLETAGETITYTMTMKVSGGKLEFGVKNGTSQTWGDFGGNGDQWRSETDTVLIDLSHYSRTVSTDHTRICFASNLVSSFVQKEVRYYKSGQLLKTDTNQVVVYEAGAE